MGHALTYKVEPRRAIDMAQLLADCAENASVSVCDGRHSGHVIAGLWTKEKIRTKRSKC